MINKQLKFFIIAFALNIVSFCYANTLIEIDKEAYADKAVQQVIALSKKMFMADNNVRDDVLRQIKVI